MRSSWPIALAGLASLGLAPWPATSPARGQPSPPSAVLSDTASQDSAPVAPPGRVGRVAALRGAVALHQSAGPWSSAQRNDPVTSGSAIETGKGAELKLEVGPSRLWLGQEARLEITRLDDQLFIARLQRGDMFLDIRDPDVGERWFVETTRATLQAERTGRFVVEAGDGAHATRFSALDAPAEIFSPVRAFRLGVERSGVFVGDKSPYRGAVGDLQVDDFTLDMGSHDPAEYASSPPVFALPPQVARMTGGENLLAVGRWQNHPAFGPLWYPPEGAGFVPYSSGTWTYVAPWGWTWVDSTSWGFAPFHYGRWVPIDGTWAWAPTLANAPLEAPPVYAPALVSFVGTNAGIGLGSGFGFDLGNPTLYPFGTLAWVPLWPGEFYLPPYPVNRPYLLAINRLAVADPAHASPPTAESLAARATQNMAALARLAIAPPRPPAGAPARGVVDEIDTNAERIMTHVRPSFARAMAARSAAGTTAGFAARATTPTPLPTTRSHASSHH